MGQFGFFDADRRLAAITVKGDPLEMIARVVPFEGFRAEIEAAVLTPAGEKKSAAGRKPPVRIEKSELSHRPHTRESCCHKSDSHKFRGGRYFSRCP